MDQSYTRFWGGIFLIYSVIIAANLIQGIPANSIVFLLEPVPLAGDLFGFTEKFFTALLVLCSLYLGIRALTFQPKEELAY